MKQREDSEVPPGYVPVTDLILPLSGIPGLQVLLIVGVVVLLALGKAVAMAPWLIGFFTAGVALGGQGCRLLRQPSEEAVRQAFGFIKLSALCAVAPLFLMVGVKVIGLWTS